MKYLIPASFLALLTCSTVVSASPQPVENCDITIPCHFTINGNGARTINMGGQTNPNQKYVCTFEVKDGGWGRRVAYLSDDRTFYRHLIGMEFSRETPKRITDLFGNEPSPHFSFRNASPLGNTDVQFFCTYQV